MDDRPQRLGLYSRRTIMKARRLLVAIAASVLCVAAFLGSYAWHQHELAVQQQRLAAETAAKLREAIIKDQELTEPVLQSPVGMTYDEFFRQCERSIDERNRLVVDVRLLPQDVLGPLPGRVISQMKALNELTRAKAGLMHLLVQWGSKARNHSDDFARLEAEFFRTHTGGEGEAIEWARKTAIAEIATLAKEIKQSADAFDEMYDKATDEDEAICVEAASPASRSNPISRNSRPRTRHSARVRETWRSECQPHL